MIIIIIIIIMMMITQIQGLDFSEVLRLLVNQKKHHL